MSAIRTPILWVTASPDYPLARSAKSRRQVAAKVIRASRLVLGRSWTFLGVGSVRMAESAPHDFALGFTGMHD